VYKIILTMINTIYLLFTLILFLNILIPTTHAESFGSQSTVGGKKFRLIKYNEIWEKALKKVPERKLQTLEGILRKLDKKELDIKHQKAEAGDNYDKQMELSIHSYLYETLKDYGLLDEKDLNMLNSKFEDPKMISLWHNAVHDADFSPEELTILKEELHHAEKGLKEPLDMDQLIKEHDEHVSQKQKPAEREMKMKRKEVKDQKMKANDEMLRLQQKVQDRMGDSSDEKFTDSRVVDLWDKAKRNGRFSKDELVVIKGELRHFQGRINKLRHWRDIHEDLKTRFVENNEHQIKEEYDHSKKSVHEHKKFIKKYHQTMKQKIIKNTEL